MRTTVLLLSLYCSGIIHAQEVDSLGIGNSNVLNRHEIRLLNRLLQEPRDTFDFENKRIAFITGNTGTLMLSKDEFFQRVKPWLTSGSQPQLSMIRLTGNEKEKSGGYDAFVLSWVKVFTDKRKRKVIKQLGNKTVD